MINKYYVSAQAKKEEELDVIEFYGLVTEKLTKLKVDGITYLSYSTLPANSVGIGVSLLSLQTQPNTAQNLFQRGVECGKYECVACMSACVSVHVLIRACLTADNVIA